MAELLATDGKRAILIPIGIGARGARYLVEYEVFHLIESHHPGFDACRALLALGVTGTIEFWHADASYPAMRIDIERGSKLTVIENDRTGPKIGGWQEVHPTQCAGTPIPDPASKQGGAFA